VCHDGGIAVQRLMPINAKLLQHSLTVLKIKHFTVFTAFDFNIRNVKRQKRMSQQCESNESDLGRCQKVKKKIKQRGLILPNDQKV
jgi:hypothetical protein